MSLSISLRILLQLSGLLIDELIPSFICVFIYMWGISCEGFWFMSDINFLFCWTVIFTAENERDNFHRKNLSCFWTD